MKLFNLRLTTLKSKLYAIVFASFVVRVVAFFALPNSASALGPDEGTYANAAFWTALGKPATEFPGYGANLYISGRSLLLPAALFNNLGINPLDSVRLASSLYGLLTLCLIAAIALKAHSSYVKFADFVEQNQRIFLTFFLIFSFIPSHFVWSVLGLKDSATEFWVIATFACLFIIFQLKKRLSFFVICGFTVSMIMVFSARPQVGWVLGLTLILYLFSRITSRISRILIPITVLGVFIGYAPTVASTVEVSTEFIARDEYPNSTPSISAPSPNKTPKKEVTKPVKSRPGTTSPTATTSPTSEAEYNASKMCNSNKQEVEFNGRKYLCETYVKEKSTVQLKNPGSVIIDQADAIPTRSEVNKQGAASAIETQVCPNAGDTRFDKYFCIAYRAPYTTYTFLVRPMLGADVTSNSSLFAAVENIFWLGALLFVAVMFIRNRRLAFFGALAPSLLFFSIYSVAAGAYEGNMGTAFRHKSLILWVVILLLASTIVATKERKAENRELEA